MALTSLQSKWSRPDAPNRALMDRYGRVHDYLRLSLTDRCNFRCVYCMPELMSFRPSNQIITDEQAVRIASVFASAGVRKIRLTGGEPTVRPGLAFIIKQIRDLPGMPAVLMTTNGLRLERQAESLRAAGLSGINISLDSLRPERFHQIARRDGLETVIRGIDAAISAGFDSVKLNMVVMGSVNEDELIDYVQFAIDRGISARFIEYMPFKSNGWDVPKMVSAAEMRARLSERFTLQPIGVEPSAVAQEYLVSGTNTTVGIIASMTESFCAGCSRLRVTADGTFKSCLFTKGTLNLKDLMRSGCSDDEMDRAIRLALLSKWKEHPPAEQLAQMVEDEMVEIGG